MQACVVFFNWDIIPILKLVLLLSTNLDVFLYSLKSQGFLVFIWLIGYLYLYLSIYLYLQLYISIYRYLLSIYLYIYVAMSLSISVCLVDLESLNNSGKFLSKTKIVSSIYLSKYLPK